MFQAEQIPALLAAAPEDWDLLYLGYFKPFKATMQPLESSGGLLSIPEYLFQTHGYLCSRAGASKLLAALPVSKPVDVFMAEHFSELKVYAATSAVCFQRNGAQGADSNVRPSCARAM